uniref:RING-type domain-containing protein n=1 Tax=Ditylenchus dipsaci TaxID=166011 RepID=A0A915E7F3_9BILA
MGRFGKCSICTVGFKITDVACLPCGHTFHYPCINRWIDSSKTCPICRKKSVERDVRTLFFDEAEALTQASPSFSDANDALEELTIQYENEKDERKKMQNVIDGLQNEAKELRVKLKQEKKKAETVSLKEERIRNLENMLTGEDHLRRELNTCKARLKAADFFAFLCGRKGENDPKAIDRYVGANGDPDQNKFFELLQGQLDKTRKQLERFKKTSEEETHSLKKANRDLENKLKKYKELTVRLTEESSHRMTRKREALEDWSPDSSPLKDLTNIGSNPTYSRVVDKSLGFSFAEESLNQNITSGDEGENDADVPIAKSSIFNRNRSHPYSVKSGKGDVSRSVLALAVSSLSCFAMPCEFLHRLKANVRTHKLIDLEHFHHKLSIFSRNL